MKQLKATKKTSTEKIGAAKKKAQNANEDDLLLESLSFADLRSIVKKAKAEIKQKKKG